MNDERKTKKQLIGELMELRQRVAAFENQKSRSRKAVDQIPESVEQLKFALEASQNGLFDWNIATGEAYFSPRYYTMLGYEPDEFPASFDSWINMIIPEDRDFAMEMVSEYYENKRDTHQIEYRMQTKTGGEHWVLSKGRMIARDDIGKPLRMVGTHSDIAARKLAEKTLQESEDRFRRLSDSSPMGIFQTGRDGDVVYLNDRWLEIAGMTREDAMGFGWVNALHPEDKTRILADWDICLKEKKGYAGEFRFVRSTGEIRWVYTKTSPIFSADGEVTGHVGANEDITSRKNTESVLVKEKEFTETALNAQQDTFFVFDPATGKAVRWNKAFCEISGYSDDEIAEMKAPESYYSVEDLEKAARFIREIMKGKKNNISLNLITKGGRKVPTEYSASVILDDAGNPQFIISIGRDITNRRKAEKALRDSEEKYRSLSETASVGIVIHEKGVTLNGNRQSFEMFGYTRDELIGKNGMKKILAPESLLDVNKKIQSGDFGPYEVTAVRKDGTRFPVEVRSAQVQYEGHNARIATLMDISDRKHAENLLKIQRDLSLAFSETSDLKQLLHELLSAAFKMKGVDAGGVYLRNTETGELDIVSHQGLPDEFIASGSHFDGDTPQAHLIAKGEPLHVHYEKLGIPIHESRKKEALKAISIIPFKHEHEVIGALNLASHAFNEFPSSTHDAIESIAGIIGESVVRTQTESLLRESEERYRMIIDRVGDVIWKLDMSGKVIFITPSVENLLGYSVDEYMACDLDQVIDKQSREEADVVMAEMFSKSDSTPRIVEQELICKDGTRKQCEVTFSLLTDSMGQPSGLVGVTRDISQRKIMEDKLHQSEKMEAIGQLAGGVAHDFNNQLTGIVGYADMLREDLRDDATLSRYADNILIGTKRAAELTAQLLAFARKGKYQSACVDIHRIISEVVSLLLHTIDKRIAIKQQLNANPPFVQGDPTLLQSAILNLALNARDAMENKGELIFTTEVLELNREFCRKNEHKIRQGAYVLICVTDTGTGIDEETQKHLFEPFFTTKGIGKGTGMGLAAVYGTVKSHNGAINVYSEPGRGSTFKVYIPLFKDTTSEVETSLEMQKTVSGSAHILLVDDEELVCNVASNMLRKLGYTVTVCRDGAEAVEEYQKSWKSIGLVILDMVMPKMNGQETYLAMRKINPDAVVLLASGYSINGEAQQILSLGVKGFIQKPFNLAVLSKKIAKILKTSMA